MTWCSRCRNRFEAIEDQSKALLYGMSAASAEWVVYAKARFGGPERVLECLGRYTHRVAIANSRLVDISDGSVAFRWKDYRHDSKPKVMRLPATQLTRRFLLHVLPSGLRRIRHYRLLANRLRAAKLERCRKLLGVASPTPAEHDQDEDCLDRYLRLTGVSLVDCPACKRGRMLSIETELPTSKGQPDGRA